MRPTLFDDVQGRENMTQYLKVKETSWLFPRNFFCLHCSPSLDMFRKCVDVALRSMV